LGALCVGAASPVFPEDAEGWADLNAHVDRHRRRGIGGIFVCNFVLVAVVVATIGLAPTMNVRALVCSWSFLPVAAVAIVARERRVALACLGWSIVLYPLSAVWAG
jgi:hypothetical protein